MSLTNPNKVITEERLKDFYDAILPYLGGMPDAICNKFDKANLYDTTEKVVGKWIDGRPLYQVTITGTLEAMTSTQESNKEYVRTIVDLPMTINETNIVDFKGVIIMTQNVLAPISGGFGFADIGTNVYRGAYGATIFISTNVNFTKMQAFIDINKWSYGGKTFYITFRYTKTTDSANSFNYADENDYSTTEHIIGTWIDGKKLYQKTIILNSSSSWRAENQAIIPFPTGLNSLVDCNIFCQTTTTKDCIKAQYGTIGINSLYWYSSSTEQGGGIVLNSDRDRRSFTFYITLKYTKTT